MKIIIQHDKMDCGPACLAMIASNYGKNISLRYLRDLCNLSREGVSILSISNAAEKIGFTTYPIEMGLEDLVNYKSYFPCILYWNRNHFVVLKKIIDDGFFNKRTKYVVFDPSLGKIKFDKAEMSEYWINANNKGILLLLVPNDNFNSLATPKSEKLSLWFFISHLKRYRQTTGFLFLLLLLGNLLNIALPFLTQNLIDKGVVPKNIDSVFYILLLQFLVFSISNIIGILRNWVTLNLGTKVSISIISDFLTRLLKLPIKFFETKMLGDLNQRIADNERIEDFLTSQSLLTFFSMVTSIVFLVILAYYDINVFIIYLSISIISLFWSSYWLRKRKSLDYLKFREKSKNQNTIFEIISGVSEMKLNSFEDFKLSEWEGLQNDLFGINKRILKVDQLQLSGFDFLNQLKNILVTFLTAFLVIDEKLTLGEMLAITYIIAQLNSPFAQFTSFMRSFQYARLSAERLDEVKKERDEEGENLQKMSLSSKNEILMNNVSFSYDNDNDVLKRITLQVPSGKVTAIVGASGSGKTTLIKLLLKFYSATKGKIVVNDNNIDEISPKSLRGEIGVVMQDGIIFSETIRRNIVMGDIHPNLDKLNNAIHIANLNDFIADLPLGLDTPIGAGGNDVSGGEKQRILIARAVYKDPSFIFLDEATSALDAENEKIIHDNLQNFFKGRTVIIVAHRLSTVKNANQIIVLKKGEIVESGNHYHLTQKKGEYFNLVKNQLELGD